jgi:hypothetical protein
VGAQEKTLAHRSGQGLSPDGWIYGGLGGTPPGAKSNAAGDPVVPSKKATGGKRSPGLQEKPRRSGAKGVSCKSGMRRVAVNIAKLPELLRE